MRSSLPGKPKPRVVRKKRIALDSTSKVSPQNGRTPGSNIGVVLVGRGSLYTQQPAEELAVLAQHLRSSNPTWVVENALLEQGGPAVPDALEACGRSGVEKVVVLPAFMPVEVATLNWIRYVARRWLDQSDASVQVVLADTLAEHANVADASVELVREAALSAPPLASIAHKPGTPEPDWSVIPPHNYHVLFCHGPRCSAAGAAELGAFLRKRLKDEGLDEGTHHVLAARSGCLYPCNLGPVMVVYPDGIWYCGLDETALSQIVEQHFLGGEPVSAYALGPSPVPQSLPLPAHSITNGSEK